MVAWFASTSGLATARAEPEAAEGPAAALNFAAKYRGETHIPNILHCYPAARGIPLSDTPHIVPMTASLWKPAEIIADFQKRVNTLPAESRPKGIIVMLKTERCATKAFRGCSVTTAAFEKRSTPLISQFVVYGAQLKPRDNDDPPGSLLIETGDDAWKNDVAREYAFDQGPGATLVFLDPASGAKIAESNAAKLLLTEKSFTANAGRTPKLEELLIQVLKRPEPAQ